MELRHKGIFPLLLLLHAKIVLEDNIYMHWESESSVRTRFRISFGVLIHKVGILGQ